MPIQENHGTAHGFGKRSLTVFRISDNYCLRFLTKLIRHALCNFAFKALSKKKKSVLFVIILKSTSELICFGFSLISEIS
jgi:hypothetical protein